MADIVLFFLFFRKKLTKEPTHMALSLHHYTSTRIGHEFYCKNPLCFTDIIWDHHTANLCFNRSTSKLRRVLIPPTGFI